MTARAIAMHQPARNVNESATQVWDFTAHTTLPFSGIVQALWTNDTGDPADLDHEHADHGCIGAGCDDGTRHGAACTAMESLGGENNGWMETTSGGSITILDPETGAVIGRAHVSAGGNGQFTLTWTQRVPVGRECQIALLALFGDVPFHVVVTDHDVDTIPFPPEHVTVAATLGIDRGPEDTGFLSFGLASRRSTLRQGSRSLTWKMASPHILRGYVSNEHCYSDPSPQSGMDGLTAIGAFTGDGFTLEHDPNAAGFQGAVFGVVGSPGPLPLGGGVVHWQNGSVVAGNPYSVLGATGTPFYAISTFGQLPSWNTVENGAEAEVYGIGFVDDRGVAYCASLRMNYATREVSSRTVRRMAGAGLYLDFNRFVSGGMEYGVENDVAEARQVTQFVALPVVEENV